MATLSIPYAFDRIFHSINELEERIISYLDYNNDGDEDDEDTEEDDDEEDEFEDDEEDQ